MRINLSALIDKLLFLQHKNYCIRASFLMGHKPEKKYYFKHRHLYNLYCHINVYEATP